MKTEKDLVEFLLEFPCTVADTMRNGWTPHEVYEAARKLAKAVGMKDPESETPQEELAPDEEV